MLVKYIFQQIVPIIIHLMTNYGVSKPIIDSRNNLSEKASIAVIALVVGVIDPKRCLGHINSFYRCVATVHL